MVRRQTARVTSKGQVTIPKRVREELSLERGDLLLFESAGDQRVVLRRATLQAGANVDRMAERIARHLESRGVPRVEVEEAIRWARDAGLAAADEEVESEAETFEAYSRGGVAVDGTAEEPEPPAAEEPELRRPDASMGDALQSTLRELRQRLDALYGDRLTRLVLFGSRARGDAEPDSDVNVMIVLGGAVDAAEELRRTSELVSRLSLERRVAISRIFLSESRFRRDRVPLLLAVRREGVAL